MLKEFNQMPSNGLRGCIGWRVGDCLILVIGFNDCYDFFTVNGNVGCANAVFRGHDEVWFSIWGELGHCNIMKTPHIRNGGIDFYNDL